MPTMPPGCAASCAIQRRTLAKVLSKRLDAVSRALQVGADSTAARAAVRLHDLPLLLVLREEVAVRQQDLSRHAARCERPRRSARAARKWSRWIAARFPAPRQAPLRPGGSAPRGAAASAARRSPDRAAGCGPRGRTPSCRCRANIMSRSSLSCQCVLLAELRLDELVELRARQRIGDADADVVGPCRPRAVRAWRGCRRAPRRGSRAG